MDLDILENGSRTETKIQSAAYITLRWYMMTDFLLLEKINELNSSTVKPRILYEKGTVTTGSFRPYMSLSDYTAASFLQNPEIETPVVIRFSKATGYSDSLRDIRGFSTRFMTEEGNYDLICHNMPVYYIKDPEKIPALIRTLRPTEEGLSEPKKFWHFLAENPETINLVMYLYSNLGTIKSYRYMEGYSINTFKWVNCEGDVLYVRYRWNPVCEGEENNERRKGISHQEAEFLAGFEADCCTRDLYEAIEERRFPFYELEIQMMDEGQFARCSFDPLSTTILWPEDDYPYLKIGRLAVMQKGNAEDNNNISFVPSNLVPGIEFTESEILKMMDYAYKDSGRQRGVLL